MFGDPNEPLISVPFETAFTIRDDLRKPINDTVRADMHENAEYPYYGANGKVDTINEYLMDCTALCLAEDCGAYGAGDTTSYIVDGKCWVNNHAHVLIPKECCDINYANAFFRVMDLSKYVSGTTRLKLTQRKMKEIPVVLPEIDQQIMFADFVNQNDKSKFMDMTSDEYIIELAIQCENDFERFRGRNIERILKVDISDLRIMAFHVVGALEGCKEIKSTGLMNLQMVLSKNTYLIRLLCKVGIKFDISEKTIDCDRKIYSIDYEKDRHSHFSSGIADKLSSVAHRVYYDYCVNVFS